VVDIVIAPATAFARLRQTPAWGWALLAGSLLGIAGALLAQPAVIHAITQSLPAQMMNSPQMAGLSPERQQAAIAQALSLTKIIAQLTWIFVPIIILITAVVQAVIMLIANAAAKGDGSFVKFFALSVTISIVGNGLASLLLGVIVELRGAQAFDDPAAVSGVLPGLAMLAPGLHGPAQGFLAVLNVFNLWAIALLALGMIGVARIPRVAAWVTAAIMLLLACGLGAVGAARQG
jgi:hypothetical protein